jgi:integrase
MPTINTHKAKDGSITYRARVRMRGMPTQTASFPTLKDAQNWAKLREGAMLAGKHFPTKTKHTLSELLERYRADILLRKTPETQRREGYFLAFWHQRLGLKLLGDITKADIVKVRNEFVKRGLAATTIHRYLNILSHVLNTAIRDYDWLEHNIVSMVSRPPLPPGKTRYLTDDERIRLLQECRRSKNKHLYSLVVLALHTGLRRSNLLGLQRRDIDLNQRTITIPRTKNGTALVLPLVGEAYELMKERCSQMTETDPVFPHTDGSQLRHRYRRAFDEAMKRARIENASFHTLRHCCGSYLIQAGVDLYTVSQILAHKSVTMSQRYSHLAIENVKDALAVLANRLSQ